MILAFETTRTRSIETVDLPEKHDVRQQYYSTDPSVSMTAKNRLAAWAMGPRKTSSPRLRLSWAAPITN